MTERLLTALIAGRTPLGAAPRLFSTLRLLVLEHLPVVQPIHIYSRLVKREAVDDAGYETVEVVNLLAFLKHPSLLDHIDIEFGQLRQLTLS